MASAIAKGELVHLFAAAIPYCQCYPGFHPLIDMRLTRGVEQPNSSLGPVYRRLSVQI
ncbi:MAG TPA: hypothetical protein VNB49_14975 [Candidatus Dormibacteraeota bacterium]|nr:hypothetical protein [Candidatus Dormibacteraeota bacterium]